MSLLKSISKEPSNIDKKLTNIHLEGNETSVTTTVWYKLLSAAGVQNLTKMTWVLLSSETYTPKCIYYMDRKLLLIPFRQRLTLTFLYPNNTGVSGFCFGISDKPFLSTSKSTVSLIEIKLESQVVHIPAVLRIKTFSKILRKTTFKSFGASLFLCLVPFIGSTIRSSRSFSTSLISFEFYLCYSSLRTSDKCSSLPLTSYHPGSDFLRCK